MMICSKASIPVPECGVVVVFCVVVVVVVVVGRVCFVVSFVVDFVVSGVGGSGCDVSRR